MLKIKFKDVNFTCENKNCGSEAWHLQHDDVRNAFTQVQHQRALHSNQCDGRHTDQLCCHLGQIPDRTSNTERLCVCVVCHLSSRMVVLWVFWRVYSQTDAFQGTKRLFCFWFLMSVQMWDEGCCITVTGRAISNMHDELNRHVFYECEEQNMTEIIKNGWSKYCGK